MTAFDLLAILVVIVSALIGFARGAVREVVTLIAFGAAALVALLALPFTAVPLRHVFHPNWVAAAAAVVLTFVVVYVALRVFGGQLARFLHAANLGGADRTLGAGVGVVRALVALGGFFLLYDKAMPRDLSPHWITGAATWPVARASGHALERLAPSGGRLSSGMGRLVRDGVSSGFGASPSHAVDGRDEGVQIGADRDPPPSLADTAPPEETTPRPGTAEARRGLRVRLDDDRSRPARHAHRSDVQESSR